MIRCSALVLLLATPVAAADPVPVAPLTGTRLALSATASVTRPPDLATVSAGVVTEARTATAAMAENAARMAGAIAALKRAGVAARDIQTSAARLGPQVRYADNQPPAITGYQATNRVTVRLRDMTRIGATLDALVAAGANQIDGPDFGLDRPEPALDEARAQALADARSRAELYARAAGLHVRRILSIDEGEASAPVVRPMMAMASRAKATTPIEGGEQTLAVTLAVTFELQ